VLEAANIDNAAKELKKRDLWVLKLFDQQQSLLYREIRLGGPRVKPEQFTVFCRQLATLVQAGVNLVESVRSLAKQTENKAFRRVLAEVAKDMERGEQFSASIAKHPSVFNQIYVSMIRAGETSGKLGEVLNRLAVFHEKDYYTRQKVRSALAYPAFMAIVAIIAVTLVLIWVVPRYSDNFASMGIELPLPTRIVVAASRFLIGNWYLLFLALAVLFLCRYLIRHSVNGLYHWDLFKLKLPVFGLLIQKQAIARFTRTFSSLHAAAIPIVQALSIVSTVTGNEAIRRVIAASRQAVQNGQPLAGPFRSTPLFPPMVAHMLAVGEKSGELDIMLAKVAEFYEADVDAMADRMKTLLEPILIATMSIFVGGIIIAILLPTFSMMGNMDELM
jgi:type IV pilus assembly protein PilC